MKAGIHPEYRDVVSQDVTSDFKILTRSTLPARETVERRQRVPAGQGGSPSSSHPFYTGQNKLIDTSGRVEFASATRSVSARTRLHRRPPMRFCSRFRLRRQRAHATFVRVEPHRPCAISAIPSRRRMAWWAGVARTPPELPVPELEQITLTAGEKSVDMPVLHSDLGPACIDIARTAKETGCFTYDPGFAPPPAASRRSPTSTAMPACCCTAATRSSSWPRSRPSPRSPTC